MALLTNINGKFSVSDAGAVTFNNAFTFPTADGTANYVLKTNGSGQLAWGPDNDGGDITGSGTANTVTKFTGAKTIGDGPITFSGNNSTFAGEVKLQSSNAFTTLRTGNDYGWSIYANSSNFLTFGSGATANTKATTWLTIQDNNGNATFAGNVGIGAAASDGNLHIRKTGVNTGITNVLMNANFADGSNGTGLSIGYRTDETTAVLAARTATGNIAFYSYDGGWSESMRIKNNGNVGIGATPNSYNNYTTLTLGNTSGLGSIFDLEYQTTRTLTLYADTNGGNINVVQAKPLIFYTSGAERMRIDSSGRTNIIGVFESSTNQGILNLNQSSGNGSLGMGFHDTGSNPHFWLQSRSKDSYSTSYALSLNPNGGNVGIGTTDPVSTWLSTFDPSTGNSTFKLTSEGWIVTPYLTGLAGYFPGQGARPIIWADAAGTNIQSWDNSATDGVSIRSSNKSVRLFVREDGNVGINQTGPSFKLDVNGTGYFADLLRVDEPVYSYTNSGTKHYTHLATASLYGSGASAAIITTNIPGHNISGNGNMFSFKIVGYAYGMGIIDMTVGLYAGENNFYSTYWSGTCQDNWIGNVYVFTNSAGATCIQLGEVTDALNCEIAVTDFVQGFGNVNANYSKGWSIAAVTTLPTQNQKTTLSYKTILPDVYEDVIFRNKVSIGATSPSANLTVSGPGGANDPVVAIDVTNSGAFNHGLEIFDANLTDGETVLMAIGKAGSTKNTAIFGYIHDADAGNNNLATIGFWGADNKMTVSAGGNVGIGTGTAIPGYKLEVSGNIRSSTVTVYDGMGGTETGIGASSAGGNLRLYAGGTNKVTVSNSAQSLILYGNSTTGSNYIQLNDSAGGSQGYVGYGSSGSNDFYFVQFKAAPFLFYLDGAVRGSISTAGTLTMGGDVVAYGSPSDKRLKENIKPIESALDKVSKLQGVTFDWKDKEKKYDQYGKPQKLQEWKEDIGFIAQDVQKVIPELVRENEDGMLSMRHQGIAPILLEAIKELKAEIEELKLNNCNCNK